MPICEQVVLLSPLERRTKALRDLSTQSSSVLELGSWRICFQSTNHYLPPAEAQEGPWPLTTVANQAQHIREGGGKEGDPVSQSTISDSWPKGVFLPPDEGKGSLRPPKSGLKKRWASQSAQGWGKRARVWFRPLCSQGNHVHPMNASQDGSRAALCPPPLHPMLAHTQSQLLGS